MRPRVLNQTTVSSRKHHSAIHCDGLIRIPKSELTNFIGSLDEKKLAELAVALKIALGVEQ